MPKITDLTTASSTATDDYFLISGSTNGTRKILSSNVGYTATLDTSNMPTLANNVSDANNDIDFSAGFCYDLSTDIKIINTALTKQLDAAFAEGTNAGGLDTGTKAVSTEYNCFAISKADGTPDFLFSTSRTAPTMPSGYVNKRRIGSVFTNSSGDIIAFSQTGDYFFWSTLLQDWTGTLSSTPTNVTVTVPINSTMLWEMMTTTGAAVIFTATSDVHTTTCTIITAYACWKDLLYLKASRSVALAVSSGSYTGLFRNRGFIDKRGSN